MFDWRNRKERPSKIKTGWFNLSVCNNVAHTYIYQGVKGVCAAAANEANGAATKTTTATTNTAATTANYCKVPKLNYAKHVQALYNLIS